MLCLVKRFLFGDDKHSVVGQPSDLSPVVDAYEHALLAIYPRPRYTVGSGTSLMALLAALPESIGDWLLRDIL